MAYPNSTQQFVIKINKNASGYYVGPEYFNVPGASPYEIYLDHVPKDSATTTVGASGGAAWTQVFVPPASAGQYLIDYTTGKTTFYSTDANTAVQATYYSLGDDIMAEHINLLQDEVLAVETELGSLPKGAQTNVTTRLDTMQIQIDGLGAVVPLASGINGDWLTDNTVRAGALMSDIKGVTWDFTRDVLTDITAHKDDITAAHDASAISATGPGTTAIASVFDHIWQAGSATPSPANPHGLTLGDMDPGIIYGSLTITGELSAGSSILGANIYGNYIFASGAAIFLANQGPDMDQYIFFYNSSSLTDKFLRWRDGDSRFEINSDIYTFGGITASGNIVPEASGTRSVGTPTVAFSAVNAVTVTADTIYGTTGSFGNLAVGRDPSAGSDVANKSYVDAAVLAENIWDRDLTGLSPHTPGDDVIPNASGSQSIGSQAMAWASGNFDTVQAVSFKTGDSTGANGFFLTNDGKTVIVSNGIIISII